MGAALSTCVDLCVSQRDGWMMILLVAGVPCVRDWGVAAVCLKDRHSDTISFSRPASTCVKEQLRRSCLPRERRMPRPVLSVEKTGAQKRGNKAFSRYRIEMDKLQWDNLICVEKNLLVNMHLLEGLFVEAGRKGEIDVNSIVEAGRRGFLFVFCEILDRLCLPF